MAREVSEVRRKFWGAGQIGDLTSSARRPRHLALGEEVDVEVGDGFAPVRAVVDHEAETGGEVELLRDEVGDVEPVVWIVVEQDACATSGVFSFGVTGLVY